MIIKMKNRESVTRNTLCLTIYELIFFSLGKISIDADQNIFYFKEKL